jgi:hypothetical protein
MTDDVWYLVVLDSMGKKHGMLVGGGVQGCVHMGLMKIDCSFV